MEDPITKFIWISISKARKTRQINMLKTIPTVRSVIIWPRIEPRISTPNMEACTFMGHRHRCKGLKRRKRKIFRIVLTRISLCREYKVCTSQLKKILAQLRKTSSSCWSWRIGARAKVVISRRTGNWSVKIMTSLSSNKKDSLWMRSQLFKFTIFRSHWVSLEKIFRNLKTKKGNKSLDKRVTKK